MTIRMVGADAFILSIDLQVPLYTVVVGGGQGDLASMSHLTLARDMNGLCSS